MTVKELREALVSHPDDLRVMVRGYEAGIEDLTADQVKAIFAQLNVHDEDARVEGQHERVESLTASHYAAKNGQTVIPALLLDRRKTEYREDDD